MEEENGEEFNFHNATTDEIINYFNETDEQDENKFVHEKEALNWLESSDSYYNNNNEFLLLDTETYSQFKNEKIKRELIGRINEEVTVNSIKQAFKKKQEIQNNKKNENEQINPKIFQDFLKKYATEMGSDYINNPASRIFYLFYKFFNIPFNDLSNSNNKQSNIENFKSIVKLEDFHSPEEIYLFMRNINIISENYNLPDLPDIALHALFDKILPENINLKDCFYHGNFFQPKPIFFDALDYYCHYNKENTQNIGNWYAYIYARFGYFQQTPKNLKRIPENFRVVAIRLAQEFSCRTYNNSIFHSFNLSWPHIDILSTNQKQELKEKKIITEEDFLNKKAAKIHLTVSSICSAIALAGLIAFCIFAPVFGPIWAPILIALYALGTILEIATIIDSGRNLDKINKFNKEVAQSETTTLANDTNNPIVAVEVETKNKAIQENDSQNQTEPRPHMDNQNQIGNQNPNRT